MSGRNKVGAYILAVSTLVFSAFLYFEGGMKGFPDGHLTELDKAEKILFFIMSPVLAFLGLFLLFLIWFAKGRKCTIIFHGVVLVLFAALLITVTIDMYLVSILENGGGG